MDGFTFIKDVTSYKLEVTYETQIINIEARAEDENALVTGTGDKALKVEIMYTLLPLLPKITQQKNIR